MGNAVGANTHAGQSPSSDGKAKAQDGAEFHSKYLLDRRIGKGSFGRVHAALEKIQAGGLHVGAKVKVQIRGSGRARYNGLTGQIVKQNFQHNLWHVKLVVAWKEVCLWIDGENLILEQKAASQASRAVKIIDLRVARGNDYELCDRRVQSCKNEASVWTKVMCHANIVRLHEVFFDKNLCYFVMERCSTSVFTYMRNLRVFNERSIGELLVQMLHAINHLHSYRVVHRDVKPDNFLMGGAEGSTVKLCDYGLSAEIPEAGLIKGIHGTAPYMCPEMLSTRLSDAKADVWSVGVVAYLLLCGKFPYQPSFREWTGKKMQEVIRHGGRPKCGRSWLSQSAASMLRKMLTRKAFLRPTAKEALHLPFIVDAMFDSNVPEENLPCLRPVLESAVSFSTCEQDLEQECRFDEYLNVKQLESHGREIPRSEPSDMPEMPPREGNWIKAQKITLSRAMACNVAEAWGGGMSNSSSDDEKLSSNTLTTSRSKAGACVSTCSTTAEQNQEVIAIAENTFTMKVEE